MSATGQFARMKSFLRTPFFYAITGGVIVGLLGWAAIAVGWVEGDDAGDAPSAVAAPPTALAADVAAGSELSVNDIYARSAPGVAFISADVTSEDQSLNPFGLPEQRQGTATGTGFVIDEDGRIVTNAHVVDGAQEIEVKLGESEETYAGEVLGADASTDIAVVEVDAPADELEPLPLGDSAEAAVGDAVIAIGNPFGLDLTATAGIVSAIQREISAPNGFLIPDAIQTDASINPGNSGGPLLNAAGEVIGVNSQIESAGGPGNVGIGFAVPIDTTREIAQQLIDAGEVEHAFLGISGTDVTPEIAEVLNLDVESGAIVQSIVPDSPADEAGVEAGESEVSIDGRPLPAGGDIIVAVDGEAVVGMTDVISAVDAEAARRLRRVDAVCATVSERSGGC